MVSLYIVNVYQRVSVDFVQTGEWEYEPTINLMHGGIGPTIMDD